VKGQQPPGGVLHPPRRAAGDAARVLLAPAGHGDQYNGGERYARDHDGDDGQQDDHDAHFPEGWPVFPAFLVMPRRARRYHHSDVSTD